MLLVKTLLRPSSVHGLGLFADEFIPAGTVVWRFEKDFDFRVSEESVERLPEVAKAALHHYSGFWNGGYVISADDSRFLNHSESPNLRAISDPDTSVAIRDIHVGEELLEDYREFEECLSHRPELRLKGPL